jgi:hypothetical protein
MVTIKYAFAHLVLLNCKQIVNFDILKRCFLTIRDLSKLPQSPGNGISEILNLKISSGLRPWLSAPQSNRASYGTACFCNMPVRKIFVFLFVNCLFIFQIANTFVASYAMKYSEIFFVIRKFLAYTPPTIHASYGPEQILQGDWSNLTY